MTNEFIVVGEHRENELELLVRGADGAYYDYNLEHEKLSPVHPDEDWVITEHPDAVDNVPAAKPSDSTV
jgi:hypothetical protein